MLPSAQVEKVLKTSNAPSIDQSKKYAARRPRQIALVQSFPDIEYQESMDSLLGAQKLKVKEAYSITNA